MNCEDIKEKINLKIIKLNDLESFLRFNKFLKEKKLNNIEKLKNSISQNIINKEIINISKLIYKIKCINEEIDETLSDISCLEELYLLKENVTR